MRETWVQSLGLEDLLEEEMATPSSILAWRILWTEELGGLQSMGSQRVGHNCVTNTIAAIENIDPSLSFKDGETESYSSSLFLMKGI